VPSSAELNNHQVPGSGTPLVGDPAPKLYSVALPPVYGRPNQRRRETRRQRRKQPASIVSVIKCIIIETGAVSVVLYLDKEIVVDILVESTSAMYCVPEPLS
jgi:hypothetical protein